MSTDTERLVTYGNELAAAGFEVWLNPYGRSGYLTYRAPNGCWGTLQESEFDGWQHLMPLKPSRENGSHMHLDTELDPWTVEAAVECAQTVNHNDVVGWQGNARTAYLSPKSVLLPLPVSPEE